MKGSKSFTISTLSPQYRSSEGRRLPFFQLEEGQHIDDGTLLDYESMPFALLLAYETDGSPSLERVKQWAEAHERLMEWFYHEDSPCLVDPVRPNQHIDFLDERSTASRLRGRYAILIQALAMRIRLQPSGFRPTIVEPWKALSSAEREEVVLEVLGTRARESEARRSYCFDRDRKLVPDFSVAALCADEGEGLIRLFDSTRKYASDPSQLFTKPILNDKFFHKFGIPHSTTDVPLSKADRAMQEEYVLRRHSMLLELVDSLCSVFTGEPRRTVPIIGNYANDFSRASRPTPGKDEDGNEWSTEVAELCSLCHRTASEAEVKKLLYCERCRSVGRNQPYCSIACQKKDWRYHKSTGGCGTRLSDLEAVPVMASDTSTSSPSSTDQLLALSSVKKIIGDFITNEKSERRRRNAEAVKEIDRFETRREFFGGKEAQTKSEEMEVIGEDSRPQEYVDERLKKEEDAKLDEGVAGGGSDRVGEEAREESKETTGKETEKEEE